MVQPVSRVEPTTSWMPPSPAKLPVTTSKLGLETRFAAAASLGTQASSSNPRAVPSAFVARDMLTPLSRDVGHCPPGRKRQPSRSLPASDSTRRVPITSAEALESVGNGAILVVDDEPAVASVLAEYLSGRGYATEQAGGGLEALSRIEKSPPAAVLLDVRMPDMDGLEVLQKIRAEGPRPPVVMMSANEDVTVAQRTIDMGALDYVLKPFDFDQIEQAVRKMLGGESRAPACSLESGPSLPAPSSHGLLYDLALDVFRTTRQIGAEARASLGAPLEAGALAALARGNSGEKSETIKALNQLRTLIRFARDLGDIDEEQHRRLEAHLVRARRANGLS
jgi:DNA-binding response OmpR family regulator